MGSVMMRWRGWNASAPSGGRGFAGSPRGLGFGFELFISTKGKSVMGPDQVSSVLSKAEKWVAAAGKRGDGMMMKTICHRAAATIARRGMRRSTQHSLKKLPSRKFVGTRFQVRTAAMLLPTPWWKEPQATSSLGPSPVSRWTGAAAGLVAWPKRFSESLMWFRDICVLSIRRCGDGLPSQSETAKKKIKGKRTGLKTRHYRPG